MVQLKLSENEQLVLFKQPNAAELLIEYTSFSDEIGFAVDLRIYNPTTGSDKNWLKDKTYAVLSPEKQEIVDRLMEQLSLQDAQRFHEEKSFLCKEAQLKIFEFPHDVIMAILKNYHRFTSWVLCDEAQLKLVETLSAEEINALRQAVKFQFCLPLEAQLKAFEVFSRDDFALVIAGMPHWQVNLFREIFPRLSKEEIKALMLALVEHGGTIGDEIQRQLLKMLPEEDTKEIFLKHLKKIGHLGDETKVKILTDYSYEDALEIIKESAETEKVVDEEVLLRVMVKFDEDIVRDILSKYIANGVEFPEEAQLNIMVELPKKDAQELLKQYKKRGSRLCQEANRFINRK